MIRTPTSPGLDRCPPRQGSLLAGGAPGLPHDGAVPVTRTDLGRGAWIDHADGWLPGSDAWFDLLVEIMPWQAARRPMYQRMVDVPRLIASVDRDHHPLLDDLGRWFDHRYQRRFGSVGCNWYRDGNDSVALHRDRVPRPGDAIIGIVSVGEPRPFSLVSDDDSRRLSFRLGHGDLLVMGGTTQAWWQHAVPKVRHAGGRICIMFRASHESEPHAVAEDTHHRA